MSALRRGPASRQWFPGREDHCRSVPVLWAHRLPFNTVKQTDTRGRLHFLIGRVAPVSAPG
eukprot:11749400-Heterocapsa_arctica.AAC.1